MALVDVVDVEADLAIEEVLDVRVAEDQPTAKLG